MLIILMAFWLRKSVLELKGSPTFDGVKIENINVLGLIQNLFNFLLTPWVYIIYEKMITIFMNFFKFNYVDLKVSFLASRHKIVLETWIFKAWFSLNYISYIYFHQFVLFKTLFCCTAMSVFLFNRKC